MYTFFVDEHQSDDGTKEVVSAKIQEFLNVLVGNIDLKTKDTALFFNALRSFEDFSPAIIVAVRIHT